MVICPACGFHNHPEKGQCASCGAELTRARYQACPVCGARNGLRDPYCISCLSLLPAASEFKNASLGVEPAEDLTMNPLAALTHSLPQAEIDFTLENQPSEMPLNTVFRRAPAARPVHAERSTGSYPMPTVLRAALYCLVALAALIPLISGLTMPPPASTYSAVVSIRQTLELLPLHATVLVSFDYGPAYAGELNPLADMVLDSLGERSARVLIMSTHPLGIANAEQAVTRSPRASQYGENYLLLGYLPGEETGLRLVANNLSGAFRADNMLLKTIDEHAIMRQLPVQRIIVITSDAENARRWLEQVTSQNPIAIDIVCSASTKPQLIPYYLSGQINSLTGGLPTLLEQPALIGDGEVNLGYGIGLGVLALLITVTSVISSLNIPTRQQGKDDDVHTL